MRSVLGAGAPLPSEPRAAVTALYHAHQRSMVGLATLLVDDRETAEDVVQEAFIRLYRAWSQIRDPHAAVGYLRITVINLCRSRLRRRVTERRWRPDEPAPAPAADVPMLERDSVDSVMRAISQLPRRQREVIVLRYYEELTEAEIAAALGISKGSVKQHASRALSALSRRLEAVT